MTPPTLTTARLVLRPATMADFPAYRDFVTSARAGFMGGPHDAATAWNWFCNDTAQWALLNMGALIISHQGRAIGQVAVCGGPIFPEPELGWFLYDAADEGQGFAAEAAAAMRDWALGPRGLTTIVAYVDPQNAASIRLAERLGGQRDDRAATPGGMATGVWRFHAGARLETERPAPRKPCSADMPEAVAFWSSDRCRAMTSAHERITPGAPADFAAGLRAALPVIETHGLRLDAPNLADFPVWAKILCSPRAHYMDGPYDRDAAYTEFAAMLGTWLLHGHGVFAIRPMAGGAALGFVCVNLEPGDHEPELGFFFTAAAEGKGITFEAASAVRDWARRQGIASLVSYVDPQNHRSVRLASRLGAIRDAAAEAVYAGTPDEGVAVFRHWKGAQT